LTKDNTSIQSLNANGIDMDVLSLLSILHLSDPTLPIGGFSHSAGLETYVQLKIVHNKQTATSFIVEMLSKNLLYTDAALLSLAYDAIQKNSIEELKGVDELCTAVKLPVEMRQASKKLGNRLFKIFCNEPIEPLIIDYKNALQEGKATGNYCVVFALIAHAMKLPKQTALTGFFYNAAVGFVTNGVKLIPLGQQDGQQILLSVLPLIQQWVDDCMEPNTQLIGMSCAGFDIRCMQHEQLYSRLYMS
jgi:urease accessory protein